MPFYVKLERREWNAVKRQARDYRREIKQLKAKVESWRTMTKGPVEFRHVDLGNAGTPSEDTRVGPGSGPVLRLSGMYYPHGARIEMMPEGEISGLGFEISKDEAERLAEIFMYVARHGTPPVDEGVAGCRYTTIGSDGEYEDE